MSMPNPADIKFKDDVESNVKVPISLDGLELFDTDGKRVALESYLGNKNVVLVFTEGFAGGMLCPFCKTQASRLVANHDKFAQRDAEILVVYPVTRDRLEEIIQASLEGEEAEVDSISFPLVLDQELSTDGCRKIASRLTHASTLIVDKKENVRPASVGAGMFADRPRVAAMLIVLESTNSQ